MINALNIKNFKSLQDSDRVTIKPITLLIGPNSSGKTSFIQFLLAIKQTLESRTRENPILINGRYVELGTFKDLIYGHDETKKLEFDFYISTKNFDNKINKILNESEENLKHNLYFLLRRELFIPELIEGDEAQLSLSSDNLYSLNRILSSRKKDISNYTKEIIESLSEQVKSNDDPKIKEKLNRLMTRLRKITEKSSEIPVIKKNLKNFDFSLLKLNIKISLKKLEKKMVLFEYTIFDKNNKLLLKVEDGITKLFIKDQPLDNLKLNNSNFFFEFSKKPDAIFLSEEDYVIPILDLLNRTVVKSVNEFFGEMYYLGPLREYPKRYYLASGEVPHDVGFKGEFFVDVLYRTKLEKRKILESLNIWMKKFNMAHEIKLEEITENVYALVLIVPLSNIPVTISDVGFGVSQVLPILVEGFHLKKGSTMIVEQPEIHLHPKVQAELGDLLIEFYKQGKSSIIETHSEHLLLRIQRRIAEGEIENTDVGIYYFEPTVNGSKIIEMEIDESGMIKNWPKGFFEEDFIESYKHIEAIVEKSKKVSL